MKLTSLQGSSCLLSGVFESQTQTAAELLQRIARPLLIESLSFRLAHVHYSCKITRLFYILIMPV